MRVLLHITHTFNNKKGVEEISNDREKVVEISEACQINGGLELKPSQGIQHSYEVSIAYPLGEDTLRELLKDGYANLREFNCIYCEK